MKKFLSYFLLICLLYLLLWPVPINPVAWESPNSPPMEGIYQPNRYLRNIDIFSTEKGPEDIAFTGVMTKDYPHGVIYTGHHSGYIIGHQFRAVDLDGKDFELGGMFNFRTPNKIGWDEMSLKYEKSFDFYNTNGRPLGMKFDYYNDNLIVADAVKGLIAINQEGVATTLTTKSDSDGIPLGFTDDLDIARDGKIYFSDASSVYGIGEDRLDLMEHRPHGRLLVYDPATKKTTTLMNNLYFANGVAVSPDDSFVLVNETYMYRIHKYWLKGEKSGTSEIIIDNLPGFPDNISSNGQGIYWVALFTVRNNFIEQTADKPFLRKMALRLPESLQPQPAPYAFVLGIDENGEVIYNLQYGADDAYSPITSVKQFGNHLYFGSLTYEGFGRVKAPE